MVEFDNGNGPLTTKIKVPKIINAEGDAKICPTCNALTLYETGCAICGIKNDIQKLKFAGRLV